MNNAVKYFFFSILIALLLSCSAHKHPVSQHIPPKAPESPLDTHDQPPMKDTLSSKRKIIVHHAISSLGTAYKWGGQSPETGFDCSGLIVYTHQKADIIVPRTAQAQFDNGKIVLKQEIKAGDLVFFKTPDKKKVFHVGIYIGDGRFVHAPGAGRRVSYGYLANPYFQKYYIGSRSYL